MAPRGTRAQPAQAAHEPPGAWELTRRQGDYWVSVLRRTWRGSLATAFVTPLLYVAAMGILLGRYVDESGADLAGADSYLQYVAAGLLAGQAMLLAMGDATWPVYGKISWDKTYVAMIATPVRVRDVVAAHLLAIVVRTGGACAVFLLALSLFGVFASLPGALFALAVQLLLALAFAAPTFAFTAGLRSEAPFALLYRVGQVPMYLFSGAFFPVTHLPLPMQWLAAATPLWHGVELTRMGMLDRVDPAAAGLHVLYLLVLAAVGCVLAVRRLTARLIT